MTKHTSPSPALPGISSIRAIAFPRVFIRTTTLAIVLLSTAAFAPTVRADEVTDWNAALEQSLRSPTPIPPIQSRAAAIVHTAIFDAVNGIARKYRPAYVSELAPAGAQADAAAVQAAYSALSSLFPAKKTLLDAQLAASLAKIPGADTNSPSVTSGRAWGDSVAKKILEWRANDGFSQTLTYPGSTAPGYWRHAPLGSVPAGGLSLTVTVPFALTNPESFDPGPPYGIADRAAAMLTAAYAADVNDVKARGRATSTVRTQTETELAQFINIADIADLNALLRRVVPGSASLVDNARTFALFNIASNDANIVIFQAKYKYGLWRPRQAIPFADESANPAIVADPTWTALGSTPSHPEYLSGHAGVTSAMLGVAAAILGDGKAFTLTTSNAGAPAITPAFASFSAYCDAVSEARVNIGYHFKSCCELSERIGFAIADTLATSALTSVEPGQFANLSVRGTAGSGQETLIAGFVIETTTKRVLIRGVGPQLAAFGVAGALADPRIVLFDSAGRVLAENDDWSGTGDVDTALISDAAAKAGAFPLAAGSKDAALLKALPPGAYTVHVSGVGGATGVALLETYQVP